MDALGKFVTAMLSNNASVSSMRFAFVFTFIIVMTTFMIVWAIVSLKSSPLQLADIPTNLWLCLATMMGIVTGGKLFQNGSEKEQSNTVSNGLQSEGQQ
jgi:hypothetical protein